MGKSLAKPDLGTKRVCPSCSARFYDLQKRPIECPKCAFQFEPEALVKQRRPRMPETIAPTIAAQPAAEASEDQEEPAAEPAAEGEDVAAAEEEEIVEAEAEEAVEPEPAPAKPVTEGGAEFEEEEVGKDEETDDNLLEEVEEDDDDVSGIIDTDIEKEEP